jgi:adenine-specific DNA-methyltransferase
VLQETVIMKGTKSRVGILSSEISVSSSHGIKDIGTPLIKRYKSENLIDFNTKEKMLHLPISDSEEQVVTLFKTWSGSLNKYNIQISTGPVVAFRSLNFIHNEYENGTVFLCPLFWLHNVNKMLLEWPLHKPDKGQYIRLLNESKSLLISNKDYIFLRRFSTKDDKSRLIAAPYFSHMTQSDYIGVENKLNYIYRPMGHLDKNEIIGLSALLNSNLFDVYFRTFNGNVNVSATELREISLPPLQTIKHIGDTIILSNDFSMDYINELVKETFELNTIKAA